MFNDPGAKLKVLAYIIFGLNALAGLIYGIWMISDDSDNTVWGLLIIGGGFLGGWLSSIVIYTIGDISETLDSMAYRVTTMTDRKPGTDLSSVPSVAYPASSASTGRSCPNCGAKCTSRECEKCGYRLS